MTTLHLTERNQDFLAGLRIKADAPDAGSAIERRDALALIGSVRRSMEHAEWCEKRSKSLRKALLASVACTAVAVAVAIWGWAR